MEGPLLFLLVFSVIAIVILLATINPFYLIRESEVGLVEKKIIGKSLTPGRVIATGEQGLQARVLPPGLHFLPKPFFKVTRIPITEVPQGQMALVTAIDGAPLKTGQLFAESAEGHTSFQDGEAFLRRGGQKGPQLEVLTPGRYRINTYLFNVQPATMIEIPQGKVGIVTATDG
ncbi:MAG TPA: flotillin family protein, partial [Acidobacteriota bacterium]|nr:flotillin family protein [Acidobacteriota bacterium]